ncbi:cytochrome P450 76A2-like [Papaver somniferum]|uniref:cytochrome P450 76A2-like n=1 Tax=Papaver somniferum TaxID=3469 RepID=UPI000E6F884F|nr:cytochrome P450 76A2-like [Papaver somniferum]
MSRWVTIFTTLADALLLLLRWNATTSSRHNRLPPGLKCCMLVGNIFELETLPHELLTAGTENIVVTTEWAMAELLRDKEAMKKVQTEISQSSWDTKYPKTLKVFVSAWALGRDPNYWDDQLAFKPGRFLGSQIDYRGHNFEFLPFGAGRRICPGIFLAEKNASPSSWIIASKF